MLKKLFGLVSLGNGVVNKTVMHCLRALCEASPPPAVLPLPLLNNLLNTLTKHTSVDFEYYEYYILNIMNIIIAILNILNIIIF